MSSTTVPLGQFVEFPQTHQTTADEQAMHHRLVANAREALRLANQYAETVQRRAAYEYERAEREAAKVAPVDPYGRQPGDVLVARINSRGTERGAEYEVIEVRTDGSASGTSYIVRRWGYAEAMNTPVSAMYFERN